MPALIPGLIRTVLGDIEPGVLGRTLIHEHLHTAPPSYATQKDPDLEFGTAEGASSELADLARAGGGAIVELTTKDYGRDVSVSVAASNASGVHVVQATGMQKGIYYPALTSRRSVEDLTEEFVRDLTTGLDGTEGLDGGQVLAGAVKVGTCSQDAIWEVEKKVVTAGGRAAVLTGAPVLTHTQGGFLGHDQLDLLEKAGLDPDQVILGHLDRNLEWDYLSSLAARGVWLGLDQWTKDKYGFDADRAAIVRRLADAGHTKVCVSGDLGRGSYQPAYGGSPGMGSALGTIRAALGDGELADLVTVTNPARFLRARVVSGV